MNLYFHDVGLKGATADFPKTVFGEVSIDDIAERLPPHLKDEVFTTLTKEFPNGFCNAWGVPSGAKSVIRNLECNDVMLLIKTTGGDGEMPTLCHVKGFWREELPVLSSFLWGSNHFPYVFFFKTKEIDLTWTQFKQDVNYLPKFRPSGNVYRVKEDRLSKFDGVDGYVAHLLGGSYAIEVPDYSTVQEPDPDTEYAEGERKVRESYFFTRNPQLVADAKKAFGYVCQACGFDFEKKYGEVGKNYIECHHKNPLSEQSDLTPSTLDDVCMLCSNCHRMIHRTRPAMSLEQLRHILREMRERIDPWSDVQRPTVRNTLV